jgi:hypothetical protein
MKNFTTNKQTLIDKGVYKNAIKTDHTNERIYITIPYGSPKNAGVTKIYKIPHKLNLERIVQFWFNSIDTNKVFTY